MIAALAYLQWTSFKNRQVARVKRLNQPKYLIGFLVGGLYFYWYFFRFLFVPVRHGRYYSGAPAIDPFLLESLGALVLLVIVLFAWVIPHKRAALTFTEAEVAFLFPAPVTRRTLIHFKLVRSQISVLFGALFFALVSRQLNANGDWLIRAASWWVILSTLNLHFLAASFAMTKLMDRGISGATRRIVILTFALLVLGVVVGWTIKTMPALTAADLASTHTFSDYAKHAFMSGPLPFLLFPFRLVVRPFLADDWLQFLRAFWPALALMTAHYVWVIRADVAFEEASVDASRKHAEKIAAVRAGNWRTAGKKMRQKRAPFNLSPTGAPALALFWKNLINAGNLLSFRLWFILVIVAIAMSLGLRGNGGNWPTVIGIFATMFSGWLLLIGPQFVRQDFRQDMKQMDVLKLFPLRGWQIAFGEILAPAMILTAIHWLLIVIALTCLVPDPPGKMPGGLILAIGLGAALVFPALNFIALIIPNAAVLLFPAWFQTGTDSPRGIEATGQRLVFAIGQFLAFGISLIPAAAVFILNLFVIKWLAGALEIAVFVSSFAATIILAIEAGFGVALLGWLFNRFDVSSEPQN